MLVAWQDENGSGYGGVGGGSVSEIVSEIVKVVWVWGLDRGSRLRRRW